MDIPVCNSQDKFGKLKVPRISIVDARFLKSYDPPCRQIKTVISTIDVKNATDADLSNNEGKKPPFTKFDIRCKDLGYKMINNVRAFNEESLIGNLGGYVGLFLGVAIWQATDFFVVVARKLKNCFQ